MLGTLSRHTLSLRETSLSLASSRPDVDKPSSGVASCLDEPLIPPGAPTAPAASCQQSADTSENAGCRRQREKRNHAGLSAAWRRLKAEESRHSGSSVRSVTTENAVPVCGVGGGGSQQSRQDMACLVGRVVVVHNRRSLKANNVSGLCGSVLEILFSLHLGHLFIHSLILFWLSVHMFLFLSQDPMKNVAETTTKRLPSIQK